MAAGPQRPQQRRALEAAEGGGTILRDTEKQTHGAGVVLEAESGSISMRHNLRKRKRPIPSSAVWATHVRGDNADAHRHNAVMSSERDRKRKSEEQAALARGVETDGSGESVAEHARRQRVREAEMWPGQMKRVRQWSGQSEDYPLSKKRVDGIAEGKVLLLTWANHHYLDFAMNWVGHMQKLGVTAYMIGALDNALLQDLVEMGVDNAFAMLSELRPGDLSWGSSHFFQMGREKIQLIEKFAAMGFDVIVSDIDTVWLKNPLPYMAKFPQADILASSDHIANTTNDEWLEKFPEAGSACNIGVLLIRKSALEFAKEWNSVLSKDNLYWDQNAFNDLIRREMDFSMKREDRLFRGYDGKLWVGILPVALFASGHTFHVQRLAEKMGLEPFVVHGTFQFSGTPGKRHRFRERLIWLPDEPSYYDPPGGLMSFDLRVGHLLEAASKLKLTGQLDDLMGHFNLVNKQLTQANKQLLCGTTVAACCLNLGTDAGRLVKIRNALAVATAIGRTLILPRLYIGADRWWAPHLGVIPGSRGMKMPMFVPADHILDIDMMSKHWDEAEFGPDIGFREYSFLSNPRTPALAAHDTLRVSICEEWETGCASPSATKAGAGQAELRLQYGLNDKELMSILQVFNGTKRIHFDDLSRGIGTFETRLDTTKFIRRTKVYASIWCCVDRHPGHVWYDMWWDLPGHVDRHQRTFQVWEPITGP